MLMGNRFGNHPKINADPTKKKDKNLAVELTKLVCCFSLVVPPDRCLERSWMKKALSNLKHLAGLTGLHVFYVYIIIYIYELYVYMYLIFYICKYVTNLKQTICLRKEEHTPSPGAKSALAYLKQADIA